MSSFFLRSEENFQKKLILALDATLFTYLFHFYSFLRPVQYLVNESTYVSL